jgi:hypothetical protein
MNNLLAAMLAAVFLAGCAGMKDGDSPPRTAGQVVDDATIGTLALRRKAEELARKIEGVKSVDNQLIITG